MQKPRIAVKTNTHEMKNYYQIIGSSFLLLLCLVPVGQYGHTIKLVFALACYAYLTFFWLHRALDKKRGVVIVLLLIPIIIFYGPIVIFYFDDAKISLPSTFAHVVGTIIGWCIFVSSKRVRLIILASTLLGTYFVYTNFYKLWLNNIDFKTYTSNVMEKSPNFLFKDSKLHNVTLKDLKKKTLVFDFWSTNCASCIKGFSAFEEFSLKFKNNPNIKFFTVNIPIKRDSIGQAALLLKKLGYESNSLYIDNLTARELKIIGVPTVIIIDSSQNIIFRGRFDDASVLLKEYTNL